MLEKIVFSLTRFAEFLLLYVPPFSALFCGLYLNLKMLKKNAGNKLVFSKNTETDYGALVFSSAIWLAHKLSAIITEFLCFFYRAPKF